MYADTHAGLPDPERQAQFYRDVPVKRLVAWIADSVVIVALSVLAVILTAFVGLLIWPLLYLAIGFAYRVVTLANGSATWGMRLAGIEFRRHDGRQFDLGYAAMHTAAYTVCLALPILQIVSVVLMLTTQRGQGLPDMALGTVALNRRAT